MANCAKVVLCVICVFNVLMAARGNLGSGHVNKSRVYDIIQSMLGFKETPQLQQRFHAGDDAPRYMLDLYELVRSGNNAQQMRGDTARSVKAQTESVNGEPMFVFNLSVIAASQEDVISAQIHLYKRKITNSKRRKDLEFLLHEIAPGRSTESNRIVIPSEVYGWQWFDVTSVVKNCISNKRTSTHALGLSINSSKSRVNSNSAHLKRFIHRHSVPYLIIYSNDSQGIGINQITQLSTQNHEHNVDITLGKVDKFPDEVEANRSNGRARRSLDENLSDSPLYSSRSRTYSILTNEIPEHPDDYDKHYPVIVKDIPTHPRMLQTRKESRHKINDPRIIPYPGDYVEKKKKKKRKNRRKKQRGKQKNKLELPKAWDDLTEMAEEDDSAQTCGKRKLTIDFNDIGWGEWIISPKSFKAHYCSGTCTFPLTKRTRPSNHATIQSLVNAVGVYPDVPAPCCVPDTMSSITLLYFDENRNVVLKNYPNMTVQKCACR